MRSSRKNRFWPTLEYKYSSCRRNRNLGRLQIFIGNIRYIREEIDQFITRMIDYLIGQSSSRVTRRAHIITLIPYRRILYIVYCKLSFQIELNQNELFIDFKSTSSHKSQISISYIILFISKSENEIFVSVDFIIDIFSLK